METVWPRDSNQSEGLQSLKEAIYVRWFFECIVLSFQIQMNISFSV